MNAAKPNPATGGRFRLGDDGEHILVDTATDAATPGVAATEVTAADVATGQPDTTPKKTKREVRNVTTE